MPNGFAITAQAFRAALTAAGAWDELHRWLDNLDKRDVRRLADVGGRAREIVYAAGLTEEVQDEVRLAYRRLKEQYGAELSVAARSSAAAEDLPTASFAGQHDTFLNVRGEALLLDAVRRCNASLFTDRTISYRIDQGFDHFKVVLSVGVMKMVRSDLAASGVMFSLDTESGHPAWSSSPPPTASARTWSRERSIRSLNLRSGDRARAAGRRRCAAAKDPASAGVPNEMGPGAVTPGPQRSSMRHEHGHGHAR